MHLPSDVQTHVFNPRFVQFVVDNFHEGYKFHSFSRNVGIGEAGLRKAIQTWCTEYGQKWGFIHHDTEKEFREDFEKMTRVDNSLDQTLMIKPQDLEKFLSYFPDDERRYMIGSDYHTHRSI